jgi:hypothetical protein
MPAISASLRTARRKPVATYRWVLLPTITSLSRRLNGNPNRSCPKRLHSPWERPKPTRASSPDGARAQARDGPRLALEPLPQVGVWGDVLGQHLDGDRTVQAGVSGLPDFAHTAFANLGGDRIRPEASTGRDGHGCQGRSGPLYPQTGPAGTGSHYVWDLSRVQISPVGNGFSRRFQSMACYYQRSNSLRENNGEILRNDSFHSIT